MTPAAIGVALWKGRTVIASAVLGLFAVVGYLSAINLARPLGIPAGELGFDRAAYVLFVALYVAFGLVWAAITAAAAFLTVVATDEWAPAARVRIITLLLAVGSAGVILWMSDEWLSGWWYLVAFSVAMAATGVVAGLLAGWPGEDARFRRAWVTLALVAVPMVFVVGLLDRLSLQGTDVANYALSMARGEPTERPLTPLALIAEPTRGLVSYGDITDRCVVRITDRVYLTVDTDPEPVRTLVVVPDQFTSNPDC